MESLNQILRDNDPQLLWVVGSSVKFFLGTGINLLGKNKYDFTLELDPPSSG